MGSVYALADCFETIQGEGSWAGTPALFIRASGCNLWSGRDEHRKRDAAKNDARCPTFCDTDFAHTREKLTEDALVDRVVAYAEKGGRLAVITGGEPLLQLEHPLVERMLKFLHVSVETNGTLALSPGLMNTVETGPRRLWVTCSPKKPAASLRIQPSAVSELKVVYPDYDPLPYREWAAFDTKLYVQPSASQCGVGVSVLDRVHMAAAAKWCMDHPDWSLSVQTHKVAQIP